MTKYTYIVYRDNKWDLSSLMYPVYTKEEAIARATDTIDMRGFRIFEMSEETGDYKLVLDSAHEE